MSDRRVHATSADGTVEIVRYDRASKWKREEGGKSKRMGLFDAVDEAVRLRNAGGKIHFGLPGGSMFDVTVGRTR